MERMAYQEKHPGTSYALRFTLFGLLPLLVVCSPLRSVRVKGVPPLNVNDSGVSTPVKVRIYQLKDDANFRNARFEELYDDHQKALGGDILDFKEVDIEPGDDRDIELGKIETHTRFIALLGLFNGTGRGVPEVRVVLELVDPDFYGRGHARVIHVERRDAFHPDGSERGAGNEKRE